MSRHYSQETRKRPRIYTEEELQFPNLWEQVLADPHFSQLEAEVLEGIKVCVARIPEILKPLLERPAFSEVLIGAHISFLDFCLKNNIYKVLSKSKKLQAHHHLSQKRLETYFFTQMLQKKTENIRALHDATSPQELESAHTDTTLKEVLTTNLTQIMVFPGVFT